MPVNHLHTEIRGNVRWPVTSFQIPRKVSVRKANKSATFGSWLLNHLLIMFCMTKKNNERKELEIVTSWAKFFWRDFKTSEENRGKLLPAVLVSCSSLVHEGQQSAPETHAHTLPERVPVTQGAGSPLKVLSSTHVSSVLCWTAPNRKLRALWEPVCPVSSEVRRVVPQPAVTGSVEAWGFRFKSWEVCFAIT